MNYWETRNKRSTRQAEIERKRGRQSERVKRRRMGDREKEKEKEKEETRREKKWMGCRLKKRRNTPGESTRYISLTSVVTSVKLFSEQS